MREILYLMNVLVLPSETTYKVKTITAVGWKEQFGHVLIEAMACKIPVIGSDSGEIPHVIGDAGLIFPEGDSFSLANCLQSIMESKQVEQELADKAYKKGINQYTNKALAKQLLSFYREILEVEKGKK